MLKSRNHKVAQKERRKTARHNVSLTVALCPSEFLLTHDLLSKDISEDGICVLTPYKLDIGEIIELGIYFPHARKPVITVGKVLRRNETNTIEYPYLLGIKFIDIAPEAYKEILHHIRYYLPRG